MKPLEEALKRLPKPHIKAETFKQNLRHELMMEARSEALRHSDQRRNAGLYWGFFTATLSAAAFAATAVLFIAIPSLPHRIHAYLAGGSEFDQQVVSNFQQGQPSSESWSQAPSSLPVNLNASDMRFLEDVFQQELPEEGFDPALLQDEGELVLRRYRDASGRTILVVTESEPETPTQDPDARVY